MGLPDSTSMVQRNAAKKHPTDIVASPSSGKLLKRHGHRGRTTDVDETKNPAHDASLLHCRQDHFFDDGGTADVMPECIRVLSGGRF
jgi:hypothetical protein